MTTPYRRRGIYDANRERESRIGAMTAGVTVIRGRILVSDVGEVSVEIPFAVNFSERPIFAFGGELDDNHRSTLGQYPTVSAVVADWVTKGEVEGAFEGYYTGAILSVVTTGQSGQAMWVHYQFAGAAVRNPLNSAETPEDVI